MAGPAGFIYHSASGKLVHPYYGYYDPDENVRLVIHQDTYGPGHLQYRFIPQDGEWGYIEHISSKMIIHSLGR